LNRRCNRQGITPKAAIANLGATWDFGVVKLFGEISRTRNKNDYKFPPLIGTGDFKGRRLRARRHRADWRGPDPAGMVACQAERHVAANGVDDPLRPLGELTL